MLSLTCSPNGATGSEIFCSSEVRNIALKDIHYSNYRCTKALSRKCFGGATMWTKDMLARAIALVSLICLVAGETQVVPAFSSVGQAVATLPELSVLNSQLSKISLASQLNSPGFVGTVFAPINSGLQPLVDALGGDLSVLGSQAQVNDIFSTSVLTTKIMLSDLQNGQQLTAMNGNTVTVTVTMVNGGKVYYINKARITTANILAGQAVIHEVTPILLPPTYQNMMESMGYKDTSTVVPTSEYANPVVVINPPSPSPSPAQPSPSPSPVQLSPPPADGGSGTDGSAPVGGSDSPDAGSGTPVTPSPSPEPSNPPLSSPKPSSPVYSSPPPSSPVTSSPSSPSTGIGSSVSGNPGTSGSGSTVLSPAPLGTFTGGAAGTPFSSGSAGLGAGSAVVTESGLARDPDFGLDISSGGRPAMAVALLALPLLLVAAL